MKIAIGGFPPDTSEAEIRQALEEFGAVVNSVRIETSEVEDKYLATVDVDTDETGARMLAEKIDGKFWKGKVLRANAYLFFK